MTDITLLSAQMKERFSAGIDQIHLKYDELTVTIKPPYIREMAMALRDEPDFDFKLLVDVCGIDYLHYGLDDWETQSSTETGFGRGVTSLTCRDPGPHDLPESSRFAVVYHLLSLTKNRRIRLRAPLPNDRELMIDSVIDVWQAADWFEREVFDLFGILFRGHPDLRRILTDYGFVGHPFRKDFPLIGKVEARYDAALKRVIYEPVSIQPRILEPKVIRHDNRYLGPKTEGSDGK